MNHSTIPCKAMPLQSLVQGDNLNGERLDEYQHHLDHCQSCQADLERLAAAEPFWTKASDLLARPVLTESNGLPLSNTGLGAGPITTSVMVEIETANSGPDTRRAVRPVAPPLSEDVRAQLDQPSHPEMLGRIDNFEIEKIIGRGGCGVVFKGFESELNRPVAIKVLAPHLAASGVARQRFFREARAAAAVVHPNVVPIHGVSPAESRPYIVMTLVNGRSLQAHVQEHGALDVKDVVRIASQVASGLSAAHRQGLIHRDIKPANILLEHDVSRVMITDFGLARAADDAAITQTGWLAGTPHYMSPEQAGGSEIDLRSDLFSLGSVIYFMATGREPFRGEKTFAVLQNIINNRPPVIGSINPDIPATLQQIIAKLLEKRPQDRFGSAEEVHRVLEQYLAYLQNPLSSPKPARIQTRRTKVVRRWLVGTAVAGIAAIGGWQWVTANPQPSQPTGDSTVVPFANSTEFPSEAAPSSLVPFVPFIPLDQMDAEMESLNRDIDAFANEQGFHLDTSSLDHRNTSETPPNNLSGFPNSTPKQ